MKKILTILSIFVLTATVANAKTLKWEGDEDVISIGINMTDVSQVTLPEQIINITVEDPDYVDVLVVKGYNNKVFRIKSNYENMATRMFLTGASGNTYVVIVTTGVPYYAIVKIIDGTQINEIGEAISRKLDENALIRAMALDKELPGINRETYVIPNWFTGSGLSFELSEIWQTPLLTGLVVHVQNLEKKLNEVNIPAINIPKTDEWGELRKASMENLKLEPYGKPNDKGLLFLVFTRK